MLRASFTAPKGNDPIAIDKKGMGKGEAWINGQSIGRYWPTITAPQNGCSDSCSYKGSFNSEKCTRNCGKPSQQLYHLPRSMIQSGSNTIVLFEMGGDPEQISFAIRQVASLCGHVSESHPAPLWGSHLPLVKATVNSTAVLTLECPYPNQLISSINFASFGTPSGKCGGFSHGQCSSTGALAVVRRECLGSKNCSVSVSPEKFGDPCKKLIKSLAVEAVCS